MSDSVFASNQGRDTFFTRPPASNAAGSGRREQRPDGVELAGGGAPLLDGAWTARATWAAEASTTLRVQLGGNHPCGQVRTALGIVPEPEQCRGCYSVLWTGFSNVSNTMKPSTNESKASTFIDQ